MIRGNSVSHASIRNLTLVFWALNGLDAALSVLNLSLGAVELNPLWTGQPPLYSMALKLAMALAAGLWFYKKGWSLVLIAGSVWMVLVVIANLITLTYIL